MKKLKLLLIVFTVFFSANLFAQDMMPPKPISSPVLESMAGTWVSNPYEMMGSTMTDECTQSMVLNGQFLKIDVKAKSSAGFVYEAIIMMAPSADGTITGWSYDIFGKNAITTYTGTWADNAVYLAGTSSWGSEIRNIKMQDGVMIQNVSFKMKDANGKEMPEQVASIIYNKK
ncbi:MAG: hypothetical protein IPL53_08135 [Ignavibacteria bacterium]|nr:hypothetical protein [Ignavibacteria bacterium]